MRQPKFKIGDSLYEVWRGHGQVPKSFTVMGIADYGNSYSYVSREAVGRWVVESHLEKLNDPWEKLKCQMENDLQRFEEAKADLKETADKVARSELPDPERTEFFKTLGRVMEWERDLDATEGYIYSPQEA